MPRGALQAANIEGKMGSEGNEGSGRNRYSTGIAEARFGIQMRTTTGSSEHQNKSTARSYCNVDLERPLFLPAIEAVTHSSALVRRISSSSAKSRRVCACNLH